LNIEQRQYQGNYLEEPTSKEPPSSMLMRVQTTDIKI